MTYNSNVKSSGVNTRHGGSVDPIDIAVGLQIRAVRRSLRLSQGEIAKMIGVSYQQLQKYETGANRISVSMLYYLASALGVPMERFFPTSASPSGDADLKADALLTRAARLPPHIREKLLDLVEVLARADAG